MQRSRQGLIYVGLAGFLVGCSTTTVPPTPDAGSPCQPACGLNASCQADGTCQCFPGFSTCSVDGGHACVSIDTDNQNCGACGMTCAAGQQCLGGQCVCQLQTCPEPTGRSSCIDTSSDPANCGGCGLSCAPGGLCSFGVCACPATRPQCPSDGGFVCADLAHDPDNCGQCGGVCGPQQVCQPPNPGANGECVCLDGGAACTAGSGVCNDLQVDTNNCGHCGNQCLSGSCHAGVCDCAAPLVRCGGACVRPSDDVHHCGSCDNDCQLLGSSLTGLVCNQGGCACGPTGQGTICGPASCAETRGDSENCGGCGHVCNAPVNTCIGGSCVCPNDKALCGNVDSGTNLACIDTTQDPANCGNCGVNCALSYASGSGCRFGSCTCAPGQAQLCATANSPNLPTCACQSLSNNCATVSFATDIYPLLAQQVGPFGCSAIGCHAGSHPAAGLAFDGDAGWAYAELVGGDAGSPFDAGPPLACDAGIPPGSPSTVCACDSRVQPNFPNVSYLASTVLNSGVCTGGLAMPINADGGWLPLDSCSQQLIVQWIESGAPF